MSVIKQGGSNPYAGKVMTTRGPQEFRRRCMGCGEYREDGLFTVRDDGKAVGPCCAGSKQFSVLDGVVHRTACEDGLCECVNREPEDAKTDDATVPDA